MLRGMLGYQRLNPNKTIARAPRVLQNPGPGIPQQAMIQVQMEQQVARVINPAPFGPHSQPSYGPQISPSFGSQFIPRIA